CAGGPGARPGVAASVHRQNQGEMIMVTRRGLIAGAAGLSFAGLVANVARPAWAQETPVSDTIPTSNGDLVIHPVEHASLVLQWGGAVIYVDPVGGAALYADL